MNTNNKEGLPGFTPPKSAGGPDLGYHRDIIERMGGIIAGDQAVDETEDVIYVYRIPSDKTLARYEQSRAVEYGVIVQRSDGYVERNTGRHIRDMGPAHEKMEFLSDMRHIVETHRRKLATAANEEYEASQTSRQAATPPGAMGHLLKEYDQLLSQIEHEHFRQRDNQEGG